jgi:hypothetical protein
MRTRAMNQIQATAMNEGVRRKKTLWSLELVDRLDSTINELTTAIEQEARKRPEVLRLMTHTGYWRIRCT